MRLRFEWDRAKAASNLRKRGVSFETAVRVFADPLARIDSDVLAWLRAQGKGYQSRINAILRREMLQALKP
jgi:uncharacterized protein (DUF4415 family)